MKEETKPEPADAALKEPRALVSRRSLLGGMMVAVVTPAVLSRAWAETPMHSERVAPGSPRTSCSPTPRFQHSATGLADGRVLVTGGWRHSGLQTSVLPLGETQIYDASANAWSRAAFLNTARAQHAAVALADGRVLVVGGVNHAPLSDTEIYDPAADTWTRAAPMPQSRYGHAASFTDGLVARDRRLQCRSAGERSNLRCGCRHLAPVALVAFLQIEFQSITGARNPRKTNSWP